ncbi:tannase/feruloyl esterase family alpha/beta hydrolase [Burkholderia gladioli]|uniref:tannase/feruloyl esterase family alpha/beta hydrolase n=1 Tax=Burkholderia gladioli TaxID=28095 RepID=UPI001FC87EE6|nr:tannase/feruloyl esterase family alpha/beta hydrolase [Burkholderia gladioli]
MKTTNRTGRGRVERRVGLALAASAIGAAALSGCHDDGPSSAAPAAGTAAATALACDASMKTRFAPDANTRVIAVKAFKAGDPLVLDPALASAATHGITRDGSVPAPAADTGTASSLAGKQLWFGMMRGTETGALAGSTPFSISTDMVALELQDPTYAGANFINASGNGANKWQSLAYADLARAYAQGISLQASFGNINTDDPDLSGLVRAGAKVLHYHGLADQLITPSGSINYYERVASRMGGVAAVQQFDRLFLVPGMGHCSGYGGVPGTAGPVQSAGTMPLPAADRQDLYANLVDWVENGKAPTSIHLSSADGSASQPICMYPTKATYTGTGSIRDAANYRCQ